jgi:hypothetical protein
MAQEKKSSGWQIIGVGVAVWVITLIVMGVSSGIDSSPQAGKAATLMQFGLPGGLVIIIIGVVILIRSRSGSR